MEYWKKMIPKDFKVFPKNGDYNDNSISNLVIHKKKPKKDLLIRRPMAERLDPMVLKIKKKLKNNI